MYSTYKKLVLFKFSLLLCCVNSADLPSNFKKCKSSDAKFSECLKDAVQDALPKLAEGIKEFKFPPIDPLYIPSLVVGEGTTGAVRVVQNFKDVYMHGISKTKIEDIKAEINDTTHVLNIYAFMDNLSLIGDYSLDGQILVLPIVGNGKCDIKLRKLRAKITIICKFFEKGGETYLKADDAKTSLKPGKVEFQFDNLFNGDKRFADPVIQLLNDNWSDVFEDIRPGYEEAIALIAKNIANFIFKNVPYKKISPP